MTAALTPITATNAKADSHHDLLLVATSTS
jgi:hypothetical protein